MRVRTLKQATVTPAMTTTYHLTPVSVKRAKTYSAQCIIADATPGVKTFVDANVNVSTDVITITAHGFATGLKVAASNAGGTLPTGLTATNYFVIALTANTIQLASSLANAQAGTAVNITAAAGGGTNSLTPASLTAATVVIEKSNDYDKVTGVGTFDAIGTPTAISGTSDVWLSAIDPEYDYVRVTFTLTAGALTATVNENTKEDE